MQRRLYIVQAQVVNETADGWQSSVGVPAFFLDKDLLGIIHVEHAKQIARNVVDPLGEAKEVHLSIAPDFDDNE